MSIDVSDDVSTDDPHAPQRLPGCGYRRAHAACHLVLQMCEGRRTEARAMLKALRQMADAHGPLSGHASALAEGVELRGRDGAIDIGLTLRGLRQLGVSREWIERSAARSDAWRQGPAARAWRLGDSGPAAPSHWEGWAADDQADLVLSLHGHSAAAVEALCERVVGQDGFDTVWVELGRLRAERLTEPAPAGREHFGYRDGLSRPAWVERRTVDGGIGRHPQAVALGELLLGHLNDVGANPWDFRDLRVQDGDPSVDPRADPNPALDEARRFFLGASFGVLRKMRQDVGVFQAQVGQAARDLAARAGFRQAMDAQLATENAQRRRAGLAERDAAAVADVYIRAQFCGRWPSGHPMQARDGWFEPTGALALPDDAGRVHDLPADAPHRGCPAFGSHVRRMNPRGDPVVPPRRRVVLRRGLPYGAHGDADVGLLGLFFCASIEDQFEHLLGAWAQQTPMGPDHVGTARDPLIGQHADATAPLEIWLPDGSAMTASLDRPSVLTQGTLYLLYLGRHGLDQVCGGTR
ncbi:hypothetical protein [Leptothrix discophora]|uniref:Dyp-type peroxidase C-terminal domain-containing protein n=1 Tax=Leptothrix discophora TaxID=89 RepID=A0ABT9G3L1_LEPDI|nr:hypothetical protein [Leptothrix discophora]MDP4301072.1 hypothetical protein [Leptothrix discophora]